MRFGLIGCGCIGNLRAKALRRVSGASLIAVADIDLQRAAKVAAPAGARVFSQFETLLALGEVDSVIVSTPPPCHEEAVLKALAAGKHVICEKPLSNSFEGCRRMLEAAKRAGKFLATGFNHRYFPAIQFLKKAVNEGAVGTLNHVRSFAGHEGLSQFRSSSEYDQAVIGGGALMDVGIHIIDLTAYILGDVREVFGIVTNRVLNLPGGEDNGFALLRATSGAVATLHASWSEWKGYRFYIEAYGDRGMVGAYYAPMMNMVVRMGQPKGKPRRKYFFYPMNILSEKLFSWQYTVVEAFRQELGDFISRCHGRKAGQIADGFAGFCAVEIANAIYRSSFEKRKIDLSEPFY